MNKRKYDEQTADLRSNENMNIIWNQIMHKFTSTLFIFLFSVPVMAATSTFSAHTDTMANLSRIESGTLLLAEAEQQQDETPEPGSLVIPGESGSKDGEGSKQCLNVCKKWGENCVINPRTGARSCRRACKEFGEECF